MCDFRWIPDAIVFDSYQVYGTPSYWVQKLFIESSGATFIDSTLNTTSSNQLIASAISWQNSTDKKNYIRIKVRGGLSNQIDNVLQRQRT